MISLKIESKPKFILLLFLFGDRNWRPGLTTQNPKSE